MRRKRRTVLASLATGIAALPGCSGTDDGPPRDAFGVDEELPASDDGDGSSANESDGSGGDGGDAADSLIQDAGLGAASVVDFETGDRTVALAPLRHEYDDGTRVELRFSETATPEGPAIVRARATNEADVERDVSLEGIAPLAPAPAAVHADEGSAPPRYFAPTADHDLVSDAPALERGPEGYWRLEEREPTWALPATVDLEPGESIDATFAFVGRGDATGLATGTYELSDEEFAVRLAAWPTSEPGTTADSRFAGSDLPPVPRGNDDEGGIRWYHDTEPTTETYLEPDTERAEVPAEISFELVNHSHETLSGGTWRLFKLVDGSWYDVGPRRNSLLVVFVRPGDTREWTLQLRRGGRPERDEGRPDPNVVPFLGGGRYAFRAMYRGNGDLHAAAFDLEGDPVELAPTEDVDATRDGDVIRASSPESEGERPSWVLTLEPLEEAAAPDHRLIPEQVMQERRRGIRNTLSLLVDAPESVDRVRLETSQMIARSVARPDGERRAFRYEGGTYALSAEPIEERED